MQMNSNEEGQTFSKPFFNKNGLMLVYVSKRS